MSVQYIVHSNKKIKVKSHVVYIKGSQANKVIWNIMYQF
jgi:hypothetical protein